MNRIVALGTVGRQLRTAVVQRRLGHGGGHGNPGPPITIDYIPVPFKSYQTEYAALQSKFNTYLAGGFLFFAAALSFALYVDYFRIEEIWRPPRSYRDRSITPVVPK